SEPGRPSLSSHRLAAAGLPPGSAPPPDDAEDRHAHQARRPLFRHAASLRAERSVEQGSARVAQELLRRSRASRCPSRGARPRRALVREPGAVRDGARSLTRSPISERQQEDGRKEVFRKISKKFLPTFPPSCCLSETRPMMRSGFQAARGVTLARTQSMIS